MKQLKIVITSRFKKDYKDAIKRGCNPELLKKVISTLTKGEKLPEKNKGNPSKDRKTGWVKTKRTDSRQSLWGNRKSCLPQRFKYHQQYCLLSRIQS